MQCGATFFLLVLGLPHSGRALTWLNQARVDFDEPAADLQGTVLLSLLPFSFVENRGQWDARTKFQARKLGLVSQLEPAAVTLQLTEQRWKRLLGGVVVRVVFEGSSAAVVLKGEEQQPGSHHYFIGNNPARWHAGVPGYRRVRYHGLYEGIDLRVQEQQGRLEYDWLLEPGARLAQIVIRAEGVHRLELTSQGSLRLHTVLGPIEQPPPTAWYELPGGRRQPVQAGFVIWDQARYGFDVPDRDPRLPMVVNPGMDVAAFLHAAAGDRPVVLAMDTRGTVTIAGRARSATRPPTLFRSLLPFLSPSTSEVFVTRVNPVDNSLIYSTSLGGDGDELVNAVAVDASGNADVGGWTNSPDFPTIPAASRPGRAPPSSFFVAWLDPAGGMRMYSNLASTLADDLRARAVELAAAPSAAPPVSAEAPRAAADAGSAMITVTSYGNPSPASCSPIRVDVTSASQADGGGMSLSVGGIPSDAGALLVVSGSEAEKRVLGSTVLVNRSDILLTLPTLPDPVTGRAELPVSLLRRVLLPGRTVYIQAFTSGCSFTAPFRASNALAASLKSEG